MATPMEIDPIVEPEPQVTAEQAPEQALAQAPEQAPEQAPAQAPEQQAPEQALAVPLMPVKTNNLPDNSAYKDEYYVFSMNRWKRKDAKHDLDEVIDNKSFTNISNNLNYGLPCSEKSNCNTVMPLTISNATFENITKDEDNNFYDIVYPNTSILDERDSFKNFLKNDTKVIPRNNYTDLNKQVNDGIPFEFSTGFYKTKDKAFSNWRNDVGFVELQRYSVSSCYLNTGSEKKKGNFKSIDGKTLLDWFDLNNASIVEDFDGGHFKQACKTGPKTEEYSLNYLFGNVTENDPAGKANSVGKLNTELGKDGITLNTWLETNGDKDSTMDRENVHCYSKYQVPSEGPGKPNMWSFFHSAYDIKLKGNVEKKCLKGSKFKTNIEFTCPFIPHYKGNPFTIQDSGANNSNARVISAMKDLNNSIGKAPVDERDNKIFELNTRVQGKNSGDVLQGLFCATSFECNFTQIDANGKMLDTTLLKTNPRYVLTHDTVLVAYCLRMGINVLFTTHDVNGTKLYVFKNTLLSSGKEMWEILFEKYAGTENKDYALTPATLVEPYREQFNAFKTILTNYKGYRDAQIESLTQTLEQELDVLEKTISEFIERVTEYTAPVNDAKRVKLTTALTDEDYIKTSDALLNVLKASNRLGDFTLLNTDVTHMIANCDAFNDDNVSINQANILQFNRAFEDAKSIYKLFYLDVEQDAVEAPKSQADIIDTFNKNVTTYFDKQKDTLLNARAGYLSVNDWVWNRRISKRVNDTKSVIGGKNNNVVDYAIMFNCIQYLGIASRRKMYNIIIKLLMSMNSQNIQENFKANTINVTNELIKRLNQGDIFDAQQPQTEVDDAMIHYTVDCNLSPMSLNSSSKVVEGYTSLKEIEVVQDTNPEEDYVLEGGARTPSRREMVIRERKQHKLEETEQNKQRRLRSKYVVCSDSMGVFTPQTSLDDDTISLSLLTDYAQNKRSSLPMTFSEGNIVSHRLRRLKTNMLSKVTTTGGGVMPDERFIEDFNAYSDEKKILALRMLSSDICSETGHDLFIVFIIIKNLQSYVENIISENNDVDLTDELITVQFLKNVIDKIFESYKICNNFRTLYEIIIITSFLNNLFLFGNEVFDEDMGDSRLNTIAYVIRRTKDFDYTNDSSDPSLLFKNDETKAILLNVLTECLQDDLGISEASISEASISEASISEASISEASISEASISEASISEALMTLYKRVSERIIEDNDVLTYLPEVESSALEEPAALEPAAIEPTPLDSEDLTLLDILKEEFPSLYQIRAENMNDSDSVEEETPSPSPLPSPSPFTKTLSPSPSPSYFIKTPSPLSEPSNSPPPAAGGSKYTKKKINRKRKFTKKKRGKYTSKKKSTRAKKYKHRKKTVRSIK